MAFAGAVGSRLSRAECIALIVLFLETLPSTELVLPLNDESLHQGRRWLKPVFAHTTWTAGFYVRKTASDVARAELAALLTVI